MKNKARITAKEFIKKYNFYEPDLNDLYGIVQSQGYTIVEFNSIANDEDVENIVNSLKLSDYIKKTRAFTYVNEDLRLVFINEDLSVDEKMTVLLHEEGHILCEHFSMLNVIGNDVQHEKEANDFVHYVLNPGLGTKIRKNRKAVTAGLVAAGVITCGISGGNYISKEMSYYGEYYVTPSGTKYHQEDCGYVKNKTNITRLTKEDYNIGKYEPCKKCIIE